MIKFTTVEIENYRSVIGKPLTVDLEALTVLVGPNNCGKSNVLRALNLFLTGIVDGSPYSSDRDYPKSSHISPKSQTKITVTAKYDPDKELIIERAIADLEAQSDQLRLDGNLIRLRLSYSKNGVESWQFLGKKGARNIKKELIHVVRDALKRSVIFKYIPVGRDSLESITRELGAELIRTIFSGWSGAVKKRQEINESITSLLEKLSPELRTSSGAVTASIRQVFPEIDQLDLRLPFENLEQMLPNLTPMIRDTAETGLQSKGAGIQTSSLLFLLKYLADNHPQRHNARVTFFWAVEEPESFLHPMKQRAMAEMLTGFSKEVQTLVTTHCPHFVPRSADDVRCYVLDKDAGKPWSTAILGDDFELARQTLGVTLLDAMALYPVNLVCEGPSDEILFGTALRRLDKKLSIDAEDVRFFPAGNATSAGYLFETLMAFRDDSTEIKLVVDGDKAGTDALAGLLGRASRDGKHWKANRDYFKLELYGESLISDRVKRLLHKERPAQIELIEDIKGNISKFSFLKNKKANAKRAMELSNQPNDLDDFEYVLNMIVDSLTSP